MFAIRLQVAVSLLLLIAATRCYAFDGERKGFVVGGGAGIGTTKVNSTSIRVNSTSIWEEKQSEWRVAPAVNFRIGYAPNNRTTVFAGAKAVLTYMDLISDAYDDYFDTMHKDDLEGTFALIAAPVVLPFLWMGGSHTSLDLIGIQYCFNDKAPAFFIEGTFGICVIPDRFREEAFGGLGFSLGIGYEFARHTSVRGDILYGSTSARKDDFVGMFDEQSSAVSLILTINVLAY